MKYLKKLVTFFLLLAIIAIHSDTSIHPAKNWKSNAHIYLIDGNEEFLY